VEYPLYADLFHNDPASIEVTSYGHAQEYRKGDAEYGHVLGILRGTRYDSVIRRQLAYMRLANWGWITNDGSTDGYVKRDSSNGVVIKVTYSSPQQISPEYRQLVSVFYLMPLDHDYIGESGGQQYLTVLFDIDREGFCHIRMTPELKTYCDSLKAASSGAQ